MRGVLFHVRVDVTVARGEVVASGKTIAPTPHENVAVALREAFDEMRRGLEEHAQRLRSVVKRHSLRRVG